MLAVRRPSVTTALHVLEGNGFIRAERGLVTIRNRAATELDAWLAAEAAAAAKKKPELTEAEKKAARDARYAARKARRK